MTVNVLLLGDPAGAAEAAARTASRAGDDVGLVSTVLRPDELRAVDSRVEETREFGGVAVQAFDEPLIVGAAVAQLSSFCDSVIVHHLDAWADRLVEHHGDAWDRLEMEVASMKTVLDAALADIVLVSAPARAGDAPAARLHRRMLEVFGPYVTETVRLDGAA
ncbi:MAG TPA: hypothetical protein VJP77_00975 [Planctomycetota bacterium]|nr:hypothetical protein [Planctomycetota bacterium]